MKRGPLWLTAKRIAKWVLWVTRLCLYLPGSCGSSSQTSYPCYKPQDWRILGGVSSRIANGRLGHHWGDLAEPLRIGVVRVSCLSRGDGTFAY